MTGPFSINAPFPSRWPLLFVCSFSYFVRAGRLAHFGLSLAKVSVVRPCYLWTSRLLPCHAIDKTFLSLPLFPCRPWPVCLLRKNAVFSPRHDPKDPRHHQPQPRYRDRRPGEEFRPCFVPFRHKFREAFGFKPRWLPKRHIHISVLYEIWHTAVSSLGSLSLARLPRRQAPS